MAMEDIDKSNAEDLELLRRWVQRFMRSEAYCEDFFTSGKENYRLYKSYVEGRAKEYEHAIFVPYSFAYMEDFIAYMMLSVFASPITFSIFPRFTKVSEFMCKELEQVVHWIFTDEEAEFVLELEEAFKNTCLFNVGYLVNYPITKEEQADSELIPGKTYPRTAFNRLQLDAPSALDVYPEPKIKRLSRMNYVMKRSWEDFSVLKNLEGKPGGYTNVDAAKLGWTEDDPITKMLRSIGLNISTQYYDGKDDRVELIDCLFDGQILTIGGRRAIIRNTTKEQVRPFLFDLPILDCRTGGAPGEFFGVGLLEAIKPTQKELNVLRSQRRDNVSLLLNKLFIYDVMAGEVDINTLFSAPGNVIMTTNKAAIDEFKISDVTASSYKEEEALLYDLQSISAMWNYARGATPRRRETATGIIRLQQAAQARNEWTLRKFDIQLLVPLCRRVITYVREHMTREMYDSIVGKGNYGSEFFDLDPKEVHKLFSIMPMTESIVSIKEVDTNQFIQAFDRLIQLPDVNRPELIKKLLQKLGQKDIKAVLPMLSEGAQAGLIQGVGEGAEKPPAPAGMPAPGFGEMAKQI